MEPSTFKPNTDTQLSERRHSDPPALWLTVILGSLVVHLCALGILRLLLMGGFPSLQSDQEIIPIDVIALAPNKTSPNPLNSTTANTRTRSSSNQPQNPQTSSVSIPSTSRTTSQPTGKRQINTNQPSSSKVIKSPESNSSSNQQPARPQPGTKPNSSNSNNPNSGSITNSSNSNSSTSSSTVNTPSNTQPGGGFVAFSGAPILRNNTRDIIHPDDDNYNDRLATIKQYNSQFSSNELTSLGITLKSVLELRVGVVIEQSGGAIVLPNATQVQRGNISTEKAAQLAAKIIEQCKFNPTLMAGQPVSRDYYLQLTIRPNQK